MKHCMECGAKLQDKYLEHEGIIPYCPACKQFRFPVFSVAVSVIIRNTTDDKVLLIQQYGQGKNIFVAGYINKGENAEETVKREIYEEVGLEAIDIHYNRSAYYAGSNTLMLNFTCSVTSDDFVMNTQEVDRAAWYAIDECTHQIAAGSLAEEFLLSYLNG